MTPILHAIDRGEVMVDHYPAGSRGPPSADAIISKAGFRKNKGYNWRQAHTDIRSGSLDIRRDHRRSTDSRQSHEQSSRR